MEEGYFKRKGYKLIPWLLLSILDHLPRLFLQNLRTEQNLHISRCISPTTRSSPFGDNKSQDSSRVKRKQTFVRTNNLSRRISTTSFEYRKLRRKGAWSWRILMRVFPWWATIQVSVFNGRRFDGGGRFFSVQSRIRFPRGLLRSTDS